MRDTGAWKMLRSESTGNRLAVEPVRLIAECISGLYPTVSISLNIRRPVGPHEMEEVVTGGAYPVAKNH
jgi:hypothetical protein